MADQSTPPPNVGSPSGKSPSPARSPPGVAPDPIEVLDDEGDDGDNDTALGSDDNASSTASITSTILQYRTIQGRTFHSEKFNTEYFAPNDDQQSESMDITHHYLTMLLDNKLFQAPLKKDMQKVLDVATGTGIWAIDFADEFPNVEVIGTDLSPIQPTWVPPNVKFELEDATKSWTWPENTFDFIHMRYLFGAIADWNALYEEAYLRCKPGGWVQSCEIDPPFYSDDGTADDETAMQTWNELVREGGKKFGRTFCVVEEGLQVPGIKAAGFVDIQEANYKVPVGRWAKDPKLRDVGQFLRSTMENDMEGYTLLLWHNIMCWPKDEYQVFLLGLRQALKNKRVHSYMKLRYVWARKPEVDEVVET
ncbi:S-adenosyl-L-methionine-dependent methyltransferase [Ilyonectria robusta]|uniref:S-adenosyl-L-methionine-dependent methyltransferase n=1 Tax=Ilyonectria robusta TaxID=1079257 RepID=UPI001E8DA988|nr:S-adenosyl-L-methionine-dependent methyltransferase [Ilyonectria robusta]KAH8675191.1 S-adenosyl-L-methionine-dependent methyltransferase [Ilyonectria robusta]